MSPLGRMQAVAAGLLVAAGALYGIATLLEPRHPAWAYAAAFGEAAMVGAIADWFAVVALFRHPLGVPVPHTAIIPASKDRIGHNLAAFLCAHFLSTPQVLERLRRLEAGRRAGDWLAEPSHAARLAAHAGAVLRYLLTSVDDARVRQFVRATVLERLAQLDAARLAGRLLALLSAEGRHQALLDALLRQLSRQLDDERLQERVAALLAAEVRTLKLLGLDALAGRYAAAKLVAGLQRLLGEMADDPAHPLRLRADALVQELIVRLQDDPALRAQAESLKQRLLAHPGLADYLQALWSELVGLARGASDAPASPWQASLAGGLATLGAQLRADTAMQAWIDQQLETAAPRWIDTYREQIRRYIVARVEAWNAEEMTRELERSIGRDLQFIRINGTLVGGLVGLAIHALTELVRGL